MTQSDAGVASLTPTKITPAELDAFSAAQVQGSFQQTSQMAAMGAFNGPVDYVGVKRGDKLIAPATWCTRGPVSVWKARSGADRCAIMTIHRC